MRVNTRPSAGLVLLAAAAAVLSAAVPGCRTPAAKYPEGLYAEVDSTRGLIVLRLEFEKTPLTVANFVGLAEGSLANAALPEGTPYFDGTVFHRVVQGHVVQCGVPKDGAESGPGYSIPNEIHPDLGHGRAGMVNMANAGPHTNGSQWCITLGDRSYLDGDYSVFGEVHEGLDAVFAIVQGDVVNTVRIVRVGRAARAFRPTTDSVRDMVTAAEARVRNEEARTAALIEETIAARWPNAVAGDNGARQLVLREGRGRPAATGETVTVSYTGRFLLRDRSFVSTADRGRPYRGDSPEPFAFTVGETRVTPGVDAAIASMRPGETRLLILPAARAYGKSGFYAPERTGEPRFVISPETPLVYEIEILAERRP